MRITKKYALIGIAVIVLIGVGLFFLGGAQSEDSNAGVKAEQSADKDDNKSEKAEKNESADKKSNATSEKKDTGNSNNSNKNNSNSGNKNNSNSSNSGSSSNSSSGSSNNTPSKPTHTHNWVAVYETQYVKVGVASICSTCGADITGKTASHAEQHMLNGENGGHYSETIYDEKQVYLYDKCSCGATR